MKNRLFEFFVSEKNMSIFNICFSDSTLEKLYNMSPIKVTNKLVVMQVLIIAFTVIFFVIDINYLTNNFDTEINNSLLPTSISIALICFLLLFLGYRTTDSTFISVIRLISFLIVKVIIVLFYLMTIYFTIDPSFVVKYCIVLSIFSSFNTQVLKKMSIQYSLLHITATSLFTWLVLRNMVGYKVILSTCLTISLNIVFIEAFFLHVEFYIRELFLRSLNDDYIKSYVEELLNKMENGLFIFEDGQIQFENEKASKHFRKFIDLDPLTKVTTSSISSYFHNNFDLIESAGFLGENGSRLLNENQFSNLTKVITRRFLNQQEISLDYSVENEKLVNSGVIKFVKLGVYQEKIFGGSQFEAYISVHTVLDIEFIELVLVDITALLEAKANEQENQWKSKLVSKISHEFITPLSTTQDLIDDIQTLVNFSCSDDDSRKQIQANTNKIHKLTEYLVLLTREVAEFIQLNDIRVRSLLKCNFEFVGLSMKCGEIAANLMNIKDDKSNFRFDHHALSIQDNQEIQSITVRGCENEFKNFILNIYVIVVKIAVNSAVIVNIEVDSTKTRQVKKTMPINNEAKIIGVCNVSISFESNLAVDNIKGDNVSSDYSIGQGVDISYLICEKLAEELDLGFEILEVGPKKIISFWLDLVDFSAKPALPNDSLNDTVVNEVLFMDSETKRILNNETSFYIDILQENQRNSTKDLHPFVFVQFDDIPVKTKKKTTSDLKLTKTNLKNESYLTKDELDDFNVSPKKMKTSFIKLPILEKLSRSKKPRATLQPRNPLLLEQKFLRRVLVVDDDANMRNVASKVVKKIFDDGVEVVQCRDGVELLFEIYTNDFETKSKSTILILTDEYMKLMNGSVAIAIIRKWEQEKKVRNIPIVSCSAFLDTANYEKITESGSNFVLSKPLQIKQLRSALESLNVI